MRMQAFRGGWLPLLSFVLRGGRSGAVLAAVFFGASCFSSAAYSAAAGILQGGAEELPPIMLSSGMPLNEHEYVLESGEYYELEIICDGSAELALSGAGLFRNIWIDEVIINDLEIRPLGLDSLEFDDEGTIEIKFVAIRPGRYELRIPGTTSDSQAAVFIIQ